MRCTAKKTFQAAADAEVGLIVQLKSNQPTLHRQVDHLCTSTAPLDRASSIDTGRNRQETRNVSVFEPGDAIADPDWRACVAAIISVERHVMTRSAKTGLWDHATHAACYLSNTPVPATCAAEAIRAHWKIESVLQTHTGRSST